jgi:hypothetical protein
MDVSARRVANFSAVEHAGDYFLTPVNATGVRRLSFLCPCGCGMLCGINVGEKDGAKVWGWNGDEDRPTATPSININMGHWHGYLTAGVFRSC